MRGALLVPIAVLAGCYSPHYEDCVISCASHDCPAGFDCRDDMMCRPAATTGTCHSIDSDARPITDSASDAPYPTGMWGSPQLVDVMKSDVSDPSLTDDLLEMYFNHMGDIYMTTRSSVSSPWSAPSVVQEIVTSNSDRTASVTPDGLTMVLASDRAPSSGIDIWVSTRTSRSMAWGTPSRVGELASSMSDTAPSLSYDGLSVVFASDRDTNNYDLFVATRAATTSNWNAPIAINELNLLSNADSDPMLSPDRHVIYFSSDRTGGGDLYYAERATTGNPFNPPIKIAELCTPANDDGDPWVSPDGRHMFFASDRDSGVLQIWEATR